MRPIGDGAVVGQKAPGSYAGALQATNKSLLASAKSGGSPTSPHPSGRSHSGPIDENRGLPRRRVRAGRPPAPATSVGTKRRPTTFAPLVAPPTFVAATICRAQETNEDAFSPLAVPERCRGAEAATRPWFKHVGLDTLFPGAGLGEVFDESSEFRAALRRAARGRAATGRQAGEVAAGRGPVRFDMTSSAQGSWFSRRPAAATHGVLRAALGASAPTGDEFYAKIGGLTLDGVAPRTRTSSAAPALGGWRATSSAAHQPAVGFELTRPRGRRGRRQDRAGRDTEAVTVR